MPGYGPETVNADLSEGELAIASKNAWITRDSLVQQIGRLQQIGFPMTAGKRRQKKIFGVRVEIERCDIGRRAAFNGALLAWRELRLELVGDGLCDLALNSENIGQIAIVSLRPEMRIGARIDQLRVYSHAIASTLNTSFHDMRDAKFISDLAQVTFRSGLILHNRSAADDFQVRDPGQVGQNFILHAVGKNALSGSRLRFSNGSTAMDFVGTVATGCFRDFDEFFRSSGCLWRG